MVAVLQTGAGCKIVNSGNFYFRDVQNLTFRSISYVGIQANGDGTNYDQAVVTSTISSILKSRILPSLKNIRLLDLRDSTPLETTAWPELLTACRSHNVVVSG